MVDATQCCPNSLAKNQTIVCCIRETWLRVSQSDCDSHISTGDTHFLKDEVVQHERQMYQTVLCRCPDNTASTHYFSQPQVRIEDEGGNLVFDNVETKRMCVRYYAQPSKVGGTLMTKTQSDEELFSYIHSMLTCSTQECFTLEKEVFHEVLAPGSGKSLRLM